MRTLFEAPVRRPHAVTAADGTFAITWRRGQPSAMYVVDRNHKQLTDDLQALPERFWRPIVDQARG